MSSSLTPALALAAGKGVSIGPQYDENKETYHRPVLKGLPKVDNYLHTS